MTPTLAAYVEAYEPDIEKVLISSDEIQAKLAEEKRDWYRMISAMNWMLESEG